MLTIHLIYDSGEIKVLKQYSKNILLFTPIKYTKENPDSCVISTDMENAGIKNL